MNNFYKLSGLFILVLIAAVVLFSQFLADLKEDLRITKEQLHGTELIQGIQLATMRTEAYSILLQFQNSIYSQDLDAEVSQTRDELQKGLLKLQDTVKKYPKYKTPSLMHNINILQKVLSTKEKLQEDDFRSINAALKYLRAENFRIGDISTLNYEGEKDLYLFASNMIHYMPEFTGELSIARTLILEGLIKKSFGIDRRNKIVHSIALFSLSKEEIEQIVQMIENDYDSGNLLPLLRQVDTHIADIKYLSDEIAQDKKISIDPLKFYESNKDLSRLSIEVHNENIRFLRSTIITRNAVLEKKIANANLLLVFIGLVAFSGILLMFFTTKAALSREQIVTKLLDQSQEAVDAFTLVCEMDTAGTIISVNKRFCDVSGYTEKELLGQSYTLLKDPSVSVDLFEKIWQTIQNKEIWTGKVKNRGKDGKSFFLDMYINPIVDEDNAVKNYVAISADVTELELIKEKLESDLRETHESLYKSYLIANERKQLLEDQKELYELVFKNTASSVLMIDIESNTFFECNESAINILNCDSKEDVLDLRPAELSPEFQPDGRRSDEKSDEMNAIAVKNGYHSFEWIYLKKTGEPFWVEVVLTPIIVHKKNVLHVVWKDIAEKKQAVQKREEQQMLMLQQSRFASMGEMIGNISHQWRQPLNALGLVLQKLILFQSRGMLDSERLEVSIEKGMNLINSMSTTIDDFRDFFNPNKEKMNFSIKGSITKAYTIVESTFDNASIEYRLEMDDDIEVYGYMNEFSQVIVNLLNNAKDAITENRVSGGHVIVKVKKNKDEIEVSVQDNAGGIPAEVADKIFDPYFTTKEEGKGTGIGLYMSKMIIEDHMDGKFDFVNIDNGACFSIRLGNR